MTTGRAKNCGLVYVRRSRKKQETGVHEQLKWARAEAERRGVRLDADGVDLDSMASRGLQQQAAVYFDDGVSGFVMSRPGFLAFRKAALVDRNVSHLFIHLSDRFARPEQAYEAMQLEIELLLAGITLVFSNRVSEPRTRGKHYFAEDVLLLHEYTQNGEFLTKLAGRVLETQISLAQGGYWNGGPPPYGFGRVLVDAAGQEVRELQPGETVKQAGCHVRIKPKDQDKITIWLYVLELHGNKGWGHKRIANHLNDLGIPSPNADQRHKTSHGRLPSGKWWPEAIKRLIGNEAIIGLCPYGKQSLGKHRRFDLEGPRTLSEADRDDDGAARLITNANPIVVATGFTPAAELDLFHRCRNLTEQRGRSQRGIPRSRDLSRYPLSSRVFDLTPGCGAVLFGRKEGEELKYECSRYRQSGGRECHRHVVAAEPTLAFVLKLLRQRVAQVGGRTALYDRLKQLAEQERPDNRPRVDEEQIAAAQLVKVEQELEAVVANMGRAKSDKAYQALEARFDVLEAEVNRLRDQVSRASAEKCVVATSASPDDEAEVALGLLDQLERIVSDREARSEISGVLQAMDLKVWLRFMDNPHGRKPRRVVQGGVVTIGPGQDPREEEGDSQSPPDADDSDGGACPSSGGQDVPAVANRRRVGRSFSKGTRGKPPVAPFQVSRGTRRWLGLGLFTPSGTGDKPPLAPNRTPTACIGGSQWFRQTITARDRSRNSISPRSGNRGRSAHEWELERERRTDAHGAFDTNPTAMGFHDLAA